MKSRQVFLVLAVAAIIAIACLLAGSSFAQQPQQSAAQPTIMATAPVPVWPTPLREARYARRLAWAARSAPIAWYQPTYALRPVQGYVASPVRFCPTCRQYHQ